MGGGSARLAATCPFRSMYVVWFLLVSDFNAYPPPPSGRIGGAALLGTNGMTG